MTDSATDSISRAASEIIAAITAVDDGPPLALPPRAYVDHEVFEVERRRVISRSWWCVGRASGFGPGDFRTFEIAGEPIVVVRDHDGELRALSNICRHRLHPVALEERGTTRWLTCPYHLWKYGLDGHLAGAPHMQDTPGFDPGNCGLPRFAVEEWLGFVFVNLDPDATALAPQVAGMAERYANHHLVDAVTVAEYRRTWAANWKLGVENGSESYHHTGIHPATVEPYLPSRGTYLDEAADAWAVHRTPLDAPTAEAYGFRLDRPSSLAERDRAEMKVATIYPGFLMLTIGDFVQWVSWIPLTVDSTDVLAEVLFPPAALAEEPDEAAVRELMRSGIEQVNGEDELAAVRLQRAAGSPHAQRGPLSTLEPVVAAFARWLGGRLGEAGTRGA